VTAIRDRQSDPEADEIPVPWDELPISGTKRGLPWWGAVLLGFGLAILGAFVDQKLQGHLTILFQACYAGGAILAVVWVQRKGLFGPMVQPPLVLAVAVPGVVLFASGLPDGNDTLGTLLKVGQPLIDGFPTMAITTGLTVIIGFIRIYRERDPERLVKVKSNAKSGSASAKDTAAKGKAKPERSASGDTGPRPAAGRTGRPRPPADGQAPPRRRPPAGEGTAGTPARRTRPAPEDGARRPRREGDPAARPRKPQDPDAPPRRRPRPPDEEGTPRRREPRDGDPRARRPRAEDLRRTENPRRAPGRRGDTPPPRSRPWDED
jgi:hypothetical protein